MLGHLFKFYGEDLTRLLNGPVEIRLREKTPADVLTADVDPVWREILQQTSDKYGIEEKDFPKKI